MYNLPTLKARVNVHRGSDAIVAAHVAQLTQILTASLRGMRKSRLTSLYALTYNERRFTITKK